MKNFVKDFIRSEIFMMTGDFIELRADYVHKSVKSYHGNQHSMPACCEAMYESMRGFDEVLYAPTKGASNIVKIKYFKKSHPFKKIGLIACSEAKLGKNDPMKKFQAQDIYTGCTFLKSKGECRSSSNKFDDFYVLSDKHDLLKKDEEISYYNEHHKTQSSLWVLKVLSKLACEHDLTKDFFPIFGCKSYYEKLIPHLNSITFKRIGHTIDLSQIEGRFNNGGQNISMISAKSLRNPPTLSLIPSSKGFYKCWAEEGELQTILNVLNANTQKIVKVIEKRNKLYCIYVGFAKNDLRQILNQVVNDSHTPIRVTSGSLPEFRQNISSIVAHNQYAKQATNDFINKLYFEWFPDEGDKNKSGGDKSSHNGKYLRPLNTDNNNHELADEIIKALENLKKESKLEV